MRFNAPSGITPLQARLATKYYAYLFIPAFIILVFFVIYLLYQMRKRIRSSPEWLEAQKKTPDGLRRHRKDGEAPFAFESRSCSFVGNLP